MNRAGLLCLLIGSLVACTTAREKDNNTLKSLENRRATVAREEPIAGNRSKAIQAYRHYLDIAPRDALRPEAMRRLGDMEIESVEQGSGEQSKQSDYRRAIDSF